MANIVVNLIALHKNVRLCLSAFLLMVYVVMLAILALHNDKKVRPDTQSAYLHKTVIQDGTHCPVCDFLFKKQGEGTISYATFGQAVGVRPRVCLMAFVAFLVLPSVISRRSGRAPPFC